MKTSFDLERLKSFLKFFYSAVGIKISVFDEGFNMITEYPEDINEYCRLIREDEKGREGCRICDRAACLEAKRRRGIYVYTCHAGLTEAVAPIMLGDGILGFVILAHMLPEEGLSEAIEKAILKAEKYGVNRKDARRALSLILPRGSERITASAKLLEAIATYLRASELVSLGMEDLSGRISGYIEQRLSERLDTSEICDAFFISRTKLHTLSVASFGMSISRYISQKRLNRAKMLLSESKSIESIAEECGYSSANYFAKVFGKAFGCSPSEYRKKKIEGIGK